MRYMGSCAESSSFNTGRIDHIYKDRAHEKGGPFFQDVLWNLTDGLVIYKSNFRKKLSPMKFIIWARKVMLR